MTTLTDLSQLTKSMVKKPVEEPKLAPKSKAEEPTVDREAAEVLAYFARPGGNAPQRPHVASRADPAKDRVAELEAAPVVQVEPTKPPRGLLADNGAIAEAFSGEVREQVLAALADALAAAQQSGCERRAGVLADVLEYPPGRRPAAKRAATRGANPATGELERRRAELKQILKDAGYFNDPKPLEKLGFKLISGRTHWKLQYANVRITMSNTPSDYRASLNTASDTANRCF